MFSMQHFGPPLTLGPVLLATMFADVQELSDDDAGPAPKAPSGATSELNPGQLQVRVRQR